MNEKLVGAICAAIMMITGGACAIGYIVGNNTFPWWLIPFAGGIICAILTMIDGAIKEKDKEKKSKRMIGCICTSISMLSVFVFLTLMMLTTIPNTWIIVMVGGILSGVIYTIYGATRSKK